MVDLPVVLVHAAERALRSPWMSLDEGLVWCLRGAVLVVLTIPSVAIVAASEEELQEGE